MTDLEAGANAPFFPQIIGKSPKLLSNLEFAGRYAKHDITLLLTGETGAGKDVIARYVHANSSRSSHPFVACNVTSVPESLIESELFGYVRGAFSGAEKDKT